MSSIAPALALRPFLAGFNSSLPAYRPNLPSQRWSIPLLGLSLGPYIDVVLPHLPSPSSLLQDIWDGILKAVPKKKMSYSRSRSRRLVGKGLKDVLSIVKCPSCGRPKRSHFLCPYCVHAVRLYWKKAWTELGVKPVETESESDTKPKTKTKTKTEESNSKTSS